MTAQPGRAVVSRGPVALRMFGEAVRRAQSTADRCGRVMSVWEGRRHSERGWLEPHFLVVRGTSPPVDVVVLADPRTGRPLKSLDDDSRDLALDLRAGRAGRVVLAAVVRPDVPKAQRRREVRAAARARRNRRGW